MSDRPVPKPGILDIAHYVPGKSKAEGIAKPVKMSANENPLGASPRAVEAFAAAATRLADYPDGSAANLRAAIAKHYGLEPERLTFGCGSDEVFEDLCQIFLEAGDNVVQGQYGFAAYAIFARSCQAEVRFAPMPNLRLTVEAVLGQIDERTKIVFLDNPCNPTGAILPFDQVRALHAALPPSVVLVLDGAYSEFADSPDYDEGFELARGASNIVVTKTFSKLGLASARVGWGYAPAEMIGALERIRQPFNLTIAGMEAAIAQLADRDFIDLSVALVTQWRPWLAQQLGGLGLEVLPSQANFVLARLKDVPGKTAKDAEAYLASKGYLVRYVANYGLPDALRITIGLEEHNRAVVELLRDFLDR
jgi:histidinol-phosphate aminotransferase